MQRIDKISYSSTLLTLIVSGLYAQTQDSYEYNSEFTWGINKNTSGGLIGGLVFKKARKIKNEKVLETFGLEIMNVKHPQEVNAIPSRRESFHLRKIQLLICLRLQYGRDIILFKKAPHQGVEIKAVFAVGPTIGIVAPYYVEYFPEGGGGFTVRAPYNPSINFDYIAGQVGFLRAWGLENAPGVNLKAAINFELGTLKSQVTGFEAGFLLDTYFQEVEMMPSSKNYSVFPTLFITLFYGSRK